MMAESQDSARELEHLQSALTESQMRESFLRSQINGQVLDDAILEHPAHVCALNAVSALKQRVASLTKDLELMQMDAGYLTLPNSLKPAPSDAQRHHFFVNRISSNGATESPSSLNPGSMNIGNCLGLNELNSFEFATFHPLTPENSHGECLTCVHLRQLNFRIHPEHDTHLISRSSIKVSRMFYHFSPTIFPLCPPMSAL